MLHSQEFLSIYIHANTSSPLIVGRTCIYDEGQGRFRTREKNVHKGCMARCYLMLILTANFCLRLILKISRDSQWSTNHLVQISGTIFMVISVLVVAQRYNDWAKKPGELDDFLNGLLCVENKFADGMVFQSTRTVMLVRFVSQITQKLVVNFFPIILAVATTLYPQIPFNVLPITITDANMILKAFQILTIGSANYLFVTMLASIAYSTIIDVLIGPICLGFGQEVIRRRILSLVNTSFKNLDIDKIFTGVKVHRSVQILVKQFSHALGAVFAEFLLAVCIAEVICAYMLLGPAKFITPLPLKLFYAGEFIETMLILTVVYGFAGDLNHQSRKDLLSLKTNRKIMQNKYFNRFVKSCQIFKIRFLMTNYIEKRTPLVFQQFCFDRIIDLLLLSKRRKW